MQSAHTTEQLFLVKKRKEKKRKREIELNIQINKNTKQIKSMMTSGVRVLRFLRRQKARNKMNRKLRI